ncbi:MAG TPA: hypothetical protein VGG89_13850 [Candidatus Baltobacteraceae bacterium]
MFRRLVPWLFAVAAIANCWELATLTVLHWNGSTGMTLLQGDEPFELRAAAVSDPALSAGFRAGDRLDARELYSLEGFANPIPGVPFRMIAHRGTHTIAATIVPVQAPLDPSQVERLVAVFWSLGFAALIAIRGAPTRENGLLLAILLALAMVSSLDRMVWPDSRVTFFAGAIISPICWAVANVALVLYAGCFGRPLSTLRKLLAAIVYIGVPFDLASAAVGGSAALYPWTDPNSGILNGSFLGGALTWHQLFSSLLCVAVAIPAARLDERQRLAWVIASFTPYLLGIAVGIYFARMLGAGDVVSAAFAVQNASFFFIPAGLTYAALAKRMFDVSFVVNRAAVFAGVSVVVVGAFVLVEWALGKWFENVSHATSLAVNAALALILGFSIRFVHQKIDAAVDNVFFRKRHENETALRRFAREAAFFTDVETLVERAGTTILSHSEATTAEVVMAAEIEPNDAAAVTMRAWHEPVDLNQCDTSLPGEMAFPMLAHGTFVGAILCGPKRTGERYAPDEIDAIRELAHGVGLAIDNLERDDRDASTFAQIAAMFAALSARLDRLAPPTDPGNAKASTP